MKKFDKASEARLLELLGEELGIFEQMKEQALIQSRVVAADEMDEFNESLDLVDKLKEKINGLHQETDPLMQSYVSSSKAGEPGSVKAIDELVEKIRSLIVECIDMNKRNIETASSKKDEYTERLKELSTSKKTFDAYTTAIPDNSEHFDKTT